MTDATLILIDSAAELARARALVDRLWDSDNPADVARLQAQARLIEAYEVSHWPRRPSSTAELIRHIMDQHDLTRADMVPILGTPSRVSEVLRGKKELSLSMVQRLRARFDIPADVLLPPVRNKSSQRSNRRVALSKQPKAIRRSSKQAQGPWTDIALHTLGWKAFQDLCAHVCEEIFKLPVEIYREAQDGGQDATFVMRPSKKSRRTTAVTVQCKFSSKSDRTFNIADLTKEENNIVALRSGGEAETYVLMTNMSLAGTAAVAIKRRLRELGVLQAHVFGREFLTRVIRSSAKHRALVPRIYGLGDLSIILDERRAEQTRALLGHMLPTLQVYVPTRPHINAVRALTKHGIVLLLGNPATGKSTIAAILATIAIENIEHRCFKVEGPEELLASWNPNEAGGFYWIDDAFGPNQLREDFVDRWIAIMPKVQAAITGGNRFVLTSRRHIYEAAKPKLGTKNHPLFRDQQATVDVGILSLEERYQILYNHIKTGSQSTGWKREVKLHLEALANESNFLPEIARRLGDPAYTQHLRMSRDALVQFFREPKEHLSQTIRELSKLHRAALTLVFLHRGNMPVGAIAPAMQALVVKHFGVDIESLGNAIGQLRDSFLVQKADGPYSVVTFKHPTIGDALSAILGETDGMNELYLRGAKPQTILTEVVCVGVPEIQDAIAVDEGLDELLVERLTEAPDEPGVNRLFFAFLDERASDAAFRKVVERYPAVLRRKAYASRFSVYDPKVRALSRALRLGLLPDDLRAEASSRLESAIFDEQDTTFLDDDQILAMFPPTKLLRLPKRIRDELLGQIPALAEKIAEEADLDIEPADNFDALVFTMQACEQLLDGDVEAKSLLEDAELSISTAIEDVKSKRNKAEEETAIDWDWYEKASQRSALQASVNMSPRSIFSDVDE
jgi:antitoxin component HigA of HigAB toxin-antitoxin module/energy-coupling factor transporter ATP-binding protein EcfA2